MIFAIVYAFHDACRRLIIRPGDKKEKRIVQPVKQSQTRPTTARLRQVIADVLQWDLPEATVLDLYAGTGQVGLDLFERGAQTVHFVEQDPQACHFIEKKTRDRSGLKIFQMSVEAFLAKQKNTYDIIFVDPPYAFYDQAKLPLEQIFQIACPAGIFLFECEKTLATESLESFFLSKNYKMKSYRISRSKICCFKPT